MVLSREAQLLHVIAFSLLTTLSGCSEVVRVLAVTGPGSSHVRAIVPGITRAFVPTTKPSSRFDSAPIKTRFRETSTRHKSNWKRHSHDTWSGVYNIRRMDHGSSFRGGTDFGVHSGTVATENMVIGAQAEQQAAFKDTSYGTGGQHYTIRHVYIVKMMPVSMSSEETKREATAGPNLRSHNVNNHRVSTGQEDYRIGSSTKHQKNSNSMFSHDNTAHDDNSGIRSDNHSESSNKDHYSAGEPDFTDTSDRYSSMRDHFTQAESRHRPTQIIVLPPPLYPDRVTIKDRHEQAENLTTVPSTLPKKENTRYRPLSSGTLENSDNASDKLVGPVQTWKAHPEVLVIRTNPVKRPTLPPLQSIHSYQPSSFSSSLNLDYY